MGKFGIGARVRHDGDVCEVIGKPEKGRRELRVLGGKHDGVVFWAPKSELEVIGLRLEIGKTYVDRDGVQHGPLVKNTSGPWVGTHPIAFGDRSWRVNGGFLPRGEDPWDLVAEVVQPAEPAKPQFEVGQRVVMVRERDGEFSPVVARIIADDGQDYLPLQIEFEAEVDFGHGASATWYVDPSDITPFTLEAGKFYRTRDGRKVGPMEVWIEGCEELRATYDGRQIASFVAPRHPEGGSYTADGIWLTSNGRDKNDIVAEWVEPVETIVVEDATDQAFSFAVGDQAKTRNGVTVKIIEIDECGVYPIVHDRGEDSYHACSSDGKSCIGEDEWDIVSLIGPQPKFKVGDRVGDFNPHGEATIRVVDGDRFRVQWDGEDEVGDYWWRLDQWEYHTSATPLAVGAEVVLTAPATIRMIHGDRASLLMPSGGAFTLPIASIRLAA